MKTAVVYVLATLVSISVAKSIGNTNFIDYLIINATDLFEEASNSIDQVTIDAQIVVNDPKQNLINCCNSSLQVWPLDMPDPWDLSVIQPQLLVFRNGKAVQSIAYDDKLEEKVHSLNDQGYLNSNEFVIITHGFHNNINTTWLHNMTEAILNVSANANNDRTVAILGWGKGADIIIFYYRQAAANIVPVGEWLGNFTKIVKSVTPKLPIYGIGHSLGAHVMGVAGRNSKAFDRISGQNIMIGFAFFSLASTFSLSGLDPAGPCFEKVQNSKAVNFKDAKFVDIMHTDGYDSKLNPTEWFFPVNHYGSLVPTGSIDFYPNYGYDQPGAGGFKLAGNHLRAIELFHWTITNPGKMITNKVLDGLPDYDEPVEKTIPAKISVEMGFYADRTRLPPNSTSLYYIKTNAAEPWV